MIAQPHTLPPEQSVVRTTFLQNRAEIVGQRRKSRSLALGATWEGTTGHCVDGRCFPCSEREDRAALGREIRLSSAPTNGRNGVAGRRKPSPTSGVDRGIDGARAEQRERFRLISAEGGAVSPRSPGRSKRVELGLDQGVPI